jgi:hypothetical protein
MVGARALLLGLAVWSNSNMATAESLPPLPKAWSKHVKSAFVHAVTLAHQALTVSRAWCANSPLERVRLRAKVDALESELGLLR